MKLTTRSITTLTTDKPDAVFWDDSLPSFGLRVRGGSRHWLIQYRHGSQQHRESLGDVLKITLEAARAAARKKFAQLELGINPLAEKVKAKAEQAMALLTLGAVADRYLGARKVLALQWNGRPAPPVLHRLLAGETAPDGLAGPLGALGPLRE
jgi:hypothetical protein